MAKYGVVLPKDDLEASHIAAWTWREYDLIPMKMDAVIGLIDHQNSNLVGSALFSNYNGCNIELSYYGPETPTVGIARGLALIALRHFNVIRVTIRTATYNHHIIRPMKKLGFEEEGIEKNFYGYDRDAVRLVLHRKGIERIAGPKAKLN